MRRSPTPIQTEKDFIRKNRTSLEYHGTIWAILFYINLMVTLYLFYSVIDQTIGVKWCIDMIFSKYQNIQTLLKTSPDYNVDDFYQLISYAKQGFVYSLIGAVVANTIHFMYAIIFSSLYININLYANLILFLSPLIVLMYTGKFMLSDSIDSSNTFLYSIVSIIIAIIGVILFLYRRQYVKTSSAIMKSSSKILLKHPSLFVMEVLQSFILLIINAMYVITLVIFYYYSTKLNLNLYGYLYASFTYYWILMTTYYVGYMTTSGVVGYEFYLGNHSSMPNLIVLRSFKRAITYQFGCACYAGLILSLFQLLKNIIDWLRPKEKKKGYDDYDSILVRILDFIRTFLYYALYLLVLLFEKMFRSVSKHALIYCSIFGVSFSDACYRWNRQSFSDKFTKIQHSLLISGSLLTNYVISTIISVLISIGLCYKMCPDFQIKSNFSYITFAFTIALMTSFYYVLNSLITTTADTLYLCFLEQPHLLSKKFNTLYKSLEKIKTD